MGLDVARVAVFELGEDGKRIIHPTNFHIVGGKQAQVGKIARFVGTNGLQFGQCVFGLAEGAKVPVFVHMDLR